MKLFIAGASGQVGRLLVAEAVQRGHIVTAMTRATTPFVPPEGVRVVHDLELAGHDAVLSCLGMKRENPANPWSPLTSPADFNSANARRIVDAMKQHGVKRVIAISAAGVAESAANMNFLMRFLVKTSSIGVAYRDLAVMEQVYADSGLDWCCVRPTRLTNGPRTGKAHVAHGFPSTSKISRADAAAYMLDLVEKPGVGERLVQIEA